mmetsp:Transcript_24111/g.28072  ORF Transcript_24111/g.28072 Transcript_24111/m.28072 type:complete len:190 (-) Transcript_24111:134-703(-)
MAPKLSYAAAVKGLHASERVIGNQAAPSLSTTVQCDGEEGSHRQPETLCFFREVEGDLMSSADSLCHCVSACLRMGKGIAVLFRDQFKRVDELQRQHVDVGGVAVLTDRNRFIYYLVTKPRFHDKPTYASLAASLTAMFSHMKQHGVTRVAMPQIGCGLDRLDWVIVRDMIRSLAQENQVIVTVYFLPK